MNLKSVSDMDGDKWLGENPWLGLSTYSEGISLYGRDEEISTLMDILCNNVATVVFGRSGIGKSSLIHAGILPEVRKRGMSPIYIRFEHNTDFSYTQQIENAVCREMEIVDRLGEQVPRMGLWDFFHRHTFSKDQKQTCPVIIIDQFEEIYTLADSSHKHLAQELFDEFADLLNNVKPSEIMAFEDDCSNFRESSVGLEGDDVLTFRIRSKKRLDYSEFNNFHIVICLREDYLYYLERNTSKIPSLKVNRFSLHALKRNSAMDVIMRPKPGLFSPEKADDIISRISTFNDEGKEEIDPTILSIFLFKYYNSKGNVNTDNIIEEFYADETRNISSSSLAYLEDNLITLDGFRHIVPYNDALAKGVTKQELEHLIDSRILTMETRKSHNYIEFSHDIVCPIAQKRRERRMIEEQARKLRKRIFAATGLVVCAVVLILSFLYLNHQVAVKDRSLTITQALNNSFLAHYMIVRGDVLSAIKLLSNIVPNDIENKANAILPETERVINEANDSLHSDYACIALLKHQDDVTTAEYSKDAELIVTASNDGVCRVWNSHSAEKLLELKSDFKRMTGASFNSDATEIVTSFANGIVLIWDVSTGRILKSLKGHKASVKYACFSPNNKYVLTASDDKTVKLWDAKTGQVLKDIIVHDDIVNWAVFNSDGSKVISSSSDGSSCEYDMISQTSRVQFSKDDCSVEYAEYSRDGSRIAVVAGDAVHIINSTTGKTETILKGHDDMVVSASFSPNGKVIATSSRDKTIRLWDIDSGKNVHTYYGHSNIVRDVMYSSDGKHLLSTSTDNEARIWNTDIRESYRLIPCDVKTLSSLTYSPNGKFIAAVSDEGRAVVWEALTGKRVSSFGIKERANSIVFSQDSKNVVIAADCNKIRSFNVENGQMTDSLIIPNVESCEYAFFAYNDKSIISLPYRGRAVQYDLEHKVSQYIMESGNDHLTSLSFNRNDSVCIASTAEKRSFSAWNLKKGEKFETFEGHENEISWLNYSHDSKMIVSASSDNTAIIWNLESATCIRKLKKHSSQVYFAEFSCDDSYVITASDDRTVRIWNMSTGEDVALRNTTVTPKYTLMFCPVRPEYIMAYGNSIRIYPLYTPKDLIKNFRSLYRNYEFTKEEKKEYSIK